MYVLQLPALHGLKQRGLFEPGPFCALRWFADQPVEPAAVTDALAALREAELLCEEPLRLEPGLAASLEIVAEPVFRLRVIRHVSGQQPRSVHTDSDGARGVSLLSDGQEVVLSPPLTLQDVATGILSVLLRNREPVRSPRVELVAAQAALLAVIRPHAVEGTLTVESLREQLTALGSEVATEAIGAALEELCEEGWLVRRGDAFSIAPDRLPQIGVCDADEIIDIEVTRFASDRELKATTRFHWAGQSLWRVEPFVAGHDHPPAAEASFDVIIHTLVGLAFVPQTRGTAATYIAGLLGLAPEKPAGGQRRATGVKVGGR